MYFYLKSDTQECPKTKHCSDLGFSKANKGLVQSSVIKTQLIHFRHIFRLIHLWTLARLTTLAVTYCPTSTSVPVKPPGLHKLYIHAEERREGEGEGGGVEWGRWVTCGAELDSAGGDESVLFKALNQSSSPGSALPDTVCPLQSSHTHTHKCTLTHSGVWCRSSSDAHTQPRKSTGQTETNASEPHTHVSQCRDRILENINEGGNGGGCSLRSHASRRAKITLDVWGADQIAAVHVRQEPRPCLSFQKSPKNRPTGTWFFSFLAWTQLCQLFTWLKAPCHVYFLSKKKYSAGSEGCWKWVLPKRVSSRWGNILPACKIKKMTPTDHGLNLLPQTHTRPGVPNPKSPAGLHSHCSKPQLCRSTVTTTMYVLTT